MEPSAAAYDPRYLAGILFFNDRDFFEAHEVWENLWLETPGPERRFYQGLIQAAVALFHFGNGNLRGAIKLYHSSREYMNRFAPAYQGLDVTGFWENMEKCFHEVLNTPAPEQGLRPRDELIPIITLDPAPESWPNLADFESADE